MWRPHWIVCELGLMAAVLASWDRPLLAGEGAREPQQRRILEVDVAPHSRPMTFSQQLNDYLTMLQGRLRREAMSMEPGLVEVKLTVRRDGSVTFREIVVLDGPMNLRVDLLPLVDQLHPLPPPPMDADMLDVSMLLHLQYPGPDLLDSIDQEREGR